MLTKTTQNAGIQDAYLSAIQMQRIPLQIFLVNGIRLIGQLEAFDNYVVILKNEDNHQMIYKHSISTIVPNRHVELKKTEHPKSTDDGLSRTKHS